VMPAWAGEPVSPPSPTPRSGPPTLHLGLFRSADLLRTESQPSDEDSATSDVLTLDNAVATALSHNRLIRSSALDVAKYGNQLAAARTQRLPQFQVTVTPAYLLAPIDVHVDKGAFGTFQGIGSVPPQDTTLRTEPGLGVAATAGVTQPIAQLYRIGLTIDQLEVARDMSRQDLRSQRQVVANNVRQVYYAVLQSESALAALQEHVTSIRELQRVLGEQVVQQAALPADLLQIKASVARAEYDVVSTQRTVLSQKERLNHLLGRDPQTPFTLSPVPAFTPLETDLAIAREVALRQRPELLKANLQVSYSDYDVRIKWAQFFPDLNLVVRYVSPLTGDVLPKNIAYAGLEFSWDVFDWGKKRQDMIRSERAAEQAKNAVAETASQVGLDVNSSFRKLQDSQAFLTVVNLNRDAAREKLRVVTTQYREQAVLLKDVLAAQASLAQAEDQYRQAVLSIWTARADFEKALGSE
jgi:outer membrane protein